MSVFDDPGNGLTTALHSMATRLEQGGHSPFYKVADLLRQAQQRIVQLEDAGAAEVHVHVDRVIYTGTEATRAAIHMLHEQAHGPVPFLTCRQDPCRDLVIDLRGPAPLSMPYGAAS